MENISTRTFRQGLAKYLALLEQGQKITINGLTLQKACTRPHADEEMAYTSQQSVYTPPFDDIKHPCEFCQKESNWETYDNGEEKYLCDACVRLRAGKMYKQTTRGMRRL